MKKHQKARLSIASQAVAMTCGEVAISAASDNHEGGNKQAPIEGHVPVQLNHNQREIAHLKRPQHE
jgi:hypothetical protein